MMIEERLGDEDRERLAARIGSGTLSFRLEQERLLLRRKRTKGLLRLFGGTSGVIAGCLRVTGLEATARRNALDIRLVENRVTLRELPPAFEGFRLLQLSDLHCDLEPALIRVIEGAIQGLACDAAVLTGDYQDRIGTNGKISLALMEKLIPLLPRPRFGVFGNHDFLCRLPVYEKAGLRILLNENAAIERGGARVYFAGIDDPRFFRTHDLVQARTGIPSGSTTVLLSHSPEVATEAAELGYSLMLCGHTHGGQLCLPGGFALWRNAPVPSRFLAGSWKENGMPGYTSRGTGACGVAARFFCPPEITLHSLHRSGD